MNNMNQYYYVYVLLSKKDGLFYTGYTKDLKKRYQEHQEGKVFSTKNRLPMKLVYGRGVSTNKMQRGEKNILKVLGGKGI